MNEVRVLCNSLLFNQGKLQVDKLPGSPNSAGASLKFPPEKSALKLKVGDTIQLKHDEFVQLAEAFSRRSRRSICEAGCSHIAHTVRVRGGSTQGLIGFELFKISHFRLDQTSPNGAKRLRFPLVRVRVPSTCRNGRPTTAPPA